jgi:hypothetical protein
MSSSVVPADIMLQPNHDWMGLIDGWTLAGLGVLRSLVLILITGGDHHRLEATLLRRSPPWPSCRSSGWRISPIQAGAATSLDPPTVAIYLKPSRWPGLAPLLLALGTMNLSPPLLAVVSAPTRTPDAKFTFLAEPAPSLNLDHVDTVYVGHRSCPTRVLPGLAPGLRRKLSHIDDPVYSLVSQVFLLFCRLHCAYDIFRLHYHGRFGLFAIDFRIFCILATQIGLDGLRLLPAREWLSYGRPDFSLPGASEPSALGEWVQLMRCHLMDFSNPHLLWWVLGEIACPAIRDLIVITPDLAFLNSRHLRGDVVDPAHLMPDNPSYMTHLFHGDDVDLEACTRIYLEPEALEAPRRPLDYQRRLAIIQEGVKYRHLEEPSAATLHVLEHGVEATLSTELAMDLRQEYSRLCSHGDFLGAHNYVRPIDR